MSVVDELKEILKCDFGTSYWFKDISTLDDLESVNEIVAWLMNVTLGKNDLRIKWLCLVYRCVLCNCTVSIYDADLLYEYEVVPVRRAIDSSISELIFEFNGDKEAVLSYIFCQLEEIDCVDSLEVFQEHLDRYFPYGYLDSFSRILEGESACVAVCEWEFERDTRVFTEGEQILPAEKTILVFSNDIYKRKKIPKTEKHRHYLFINEVLDYFEGSSSESREDIFFKISLQRGEGEKKRAKADGVFVNGDALRKVTDELLVDHHAWKIKTINELVSGVVGEDPSVQNASFLPVISTYKTLARIAHDFKKIEEMLRSTRINFQIIRVNDPGVHAEMRLVDFFLENVFLKNDYGISPVYMGISKLCCRDCERAVNGINHALKDKFGLEVFSYGCSSSRTGHGLEFTWVSPRFLDSNSEYAHEGLEEAARLAITYFDKVVPTEPSKPVRMSATASNSDDGEVAAVDATSVLDKKGKAMVVNSKASLFSEDCSNDENSVDEKEAIQNILNTLEKDEAKAMLEQLLEELSVDLAEP